MKIKPILWIGSSKSDLISMPEDIKDEFGFALYQAQKGGKSDKAKPFTGYGSAAVLEVVENDAHGTYRAVYTVKFAEAIVVLHVFQKKSKRGIETPKQDLDLVDSRLILAKQIYNNFLKKRGKQ